MAWVGEPFKAVFGKDSLTAYRRSILREQAQLIDAGSLFLLILNVRTDRCLIGTYGRNKIAPSSEVHPGVVLAPTQVAPHNVDRTLALDCVWWCAGSG